MVVRPDRVHGIRAVLLGLVRLVSVGLVLWGAFGIGNRLLYAVVGNGDLKQAWTAWMGAGESHGVFSGVPMVMIGLGLAIWSRPLVRWVVRPAELGCPRCGHEVMAGLDRCPECGQEMGGRGA